jgi:hypothetical protein
VNPRKLIIVAAGLTFIIVVLLVLRGFTGGGGDRFPELQPALDVPPGYSFDFRDGPDFYTWIIAEARKVGARPRSGVGMYIGLHPDISHTQGTVERAAGKVCGRSVTWMIERAGDANEPWIRQDAVFQYEHGAGYRAVALHVWVWGPTSEVVAGLAKRLETMKLVAR